MLREGTKTIRVNGKICFGGRSFLSVLASTVAFGLVAMLSADTPTQCQPGILDISFRGTGKVTTDIGNSNDNGAALAIQADGKIVVVGPSFDGSNYNFAVVRYNSDGSLDTSFNGTGKVITNISGSSDDRALSVAIQSDGKIVVAGASYYIGNDDFAVVRYNSDGSLDPSFNGNGKVTTDFGGSGEVARSVAIQGDGKIVVAGDSNYDFAVVRYNSDGTLDTSFNGTGKVTTSVGNGDDVGNSVAIQGDCKIVVAGYSNSGSNYDFAVVRFNSDGSLDTSFNGIGKVTTDFGGSDDSGYSVAIQADGKIVVAGGIGSYPNYYFAIVRYNANGSLDASFNGTGKVITDFGNHSDEGRSVAIQGDGKIVVAGSTFNPNSRADIAVARYNSDGSLDTSFNGTGKAVTGIDISDDEGHSVAIQGDGKIVVSGYSRIGSGTDFAVVRYIGECAPLQLRFAVSRKRHGSAGNFDVDLPITGQPGVECRIAETGGNHTLVFTFNSQIVDGNASVTRGSGSVSGSPRIAGNTMTVNLTGVNNAQTLTVTLNGVTDQFSQVLPDVAVSVKMLVGDTNGNGSVNASDVGQTKFQIGQPVTPANFRTDVNVSGAINSTDVALVKAHSG